MHKKWYKIDILRRQVAGTSRPASWVLCKNDRSRFEKRPQWFWKTTAVISENVLPRLENAGRRFGKGCPSFWKRKTFVSENEGHRF